MRWTWQYLCLLIGVVAVLYAPSLQNGFLFEDRAVLNSLPAKAGQAGVLEAVREVSPEGCWRPVSRVSLLVQKGNGSADDPVPFRALNVMLMALVGLAAFGLMRQPALGIRRMAAFLAALLLVAHPVASSSVYRIGDGRDTLLALLFSLGSAAFYLRGTGWSTAISAVCCALALGSSEQAIWLPMVLLAAEALGLPGRDGHETEGDLGPAHLTVVPQNERKWLTWFRVFSILLVVVLFLVVRRGVLGDMRPTDLVQGRMPFFEWVYAWQVLAAPGRAVVFQPSLSVWLTGWRVFAGMGLFVLLALAVGLAIRHPEATPRARRALEARRVAFWAVWLIATRLAATGLLADAPLFDEGQELAFSTAVWGALAWSVSRFWNVDWVRRELIVFGAGAVVVLAAMSLGRGGYYRDDETFTSQWARTNPEAWRGYARRAEAWESAGCLDAADREAKRGLMLQPYAPELMQRQGSIQEKAGRLEEALLTFQEMAERNPTNWTSREKVADLTFKLGRFRAASDLYLVLSDALPEKEELKGKLEAARKAELGHSP